MESLCGMLNSEGGSVVFGVTDDGNVVGQEVGDSTKREIASCIREFEPFPLLNIEYVGIPNTDKQLIVITTTSTDDKPFVYKGRPYMRVESTTATMPQARYHDLLDRSNRAVIQWERRTNQELTLSDLDEEEIKRTVRIGVEMGRLPEAAYRSDIPTVLTNRIDEGWTVDKCCSRVVSETRDDGIPTAVVAPCPIPRHGQPRVP